MKRILVPTKRVPDPDQRIKVAADGISLDEESLQFVPNPFDLIAVEESLRIRESTGEETEVVTVGVGSAEYEKTMRSTLAMGADRSILVEIQQAHDSAPDPWNIATILAAIVKKEQPDLILMGKQAIDDDSNQVGQFLAGMLDWPQATFASRVEIHDSSIIVDRETDTGVEQLAMTLPAVVTVDLRLNEPRYASMPAMMKAKRKPLDRITLEDLAVTLEPRIETLHLETHTTTRTCQICSSVDEFIQELRNAGAL